MSTRSDENDSGIATPLTRLPFPHVTKSHILHCSYHYWHPRYRTVTPKARLIPLPPAFLSYLRADGIILPPESSRRNSVSHSRRNNWNDDHDSGIFTSSSINSSEDDEDDEIDPSAEWRSTHEAIIATIAELGGKVVPKLNWSAPKDSTWINATNSMDCTTPNDIYLLLKSSDFVTHDLEHAFYGCVDDNNTLAERSSLSLVGSPEATSNSADIPYYLVLRKHVPMNPALEFRCFVRNRTLLALSQRSPNHLPFLLQLRPKLLTLIQEFFSRHLKASFPDPNFVFDVYVPQPYTRVWLVDINPWAPRTDPLLFSWLELLTMEAPELELEQGHGELDQGVVRLQLSTNDGNSTTPATSHDILTSQTAAESTSSRPSTSSSSADEESDETLSPRLELRLISRTDPEAFNFSTPAYSAHKLPREVVEASKDGPASMQEFAATWRDIVRKHEEQEKKAEGKSGEESV